MKKVKRKYEHLDKGVIYLVFCVWIFGDAANKPLIYSPLGILLFYHLLNLFLGRRRVMYYNKFFKIFPLILILVWIYGVFVGLLNDNDYVFTNNVGILFFGTYYFLSYNKLTVNQILKILFNLSLISSLYYLAHFSFDGLAFKLGRQGGFSVMTLFPATIIPYSIYYIFFTEEKRTIVVSKYALVIVLLLISFVTVFLVFSKGILLSLIITILALSARQYYNRKLTKFPWLLVLVLVPLIILNTRSTDNQITIFGAHEGSNELRYDFAHVIIKELSYQGKGWGAPFIDPYLRHRNGLGYSSELSYLNLIHKIGIFSLVYFSFYIWTLFQIWKCLVSNKSQKINTGLLSMGLITYLFLSLGNPTLFAPAFVFMHVLSIHSLNKYLLLYSHDK